MAATPTLPTRQRGQDWLLSCTDQPITAQRLWDGEELAPFPSGGCWRVVEAFLLRSVHAMKRISRDRLGLVLAEVETDRAWWLVHPAFADELDDVRALHVRPAGWVLECPPVLYGVGGRVWLDDLTGPADSPPLSCSAPRSGRVGLDSLRRHNHDDDGDRGPGTGGGRG